ncbi:MAG TPA: GAF domain-containing protein, partial [Terriglobales bacterium]|nr:GAF domain-containing protein [Terriglobales bacterium]
MTTMTPVPESPVSLLHRISSIVSSDLSLEEMLGEIVGLTAQVTECDACLVYLMDREANEIVLRASQVPHASALGELRMKIGEGVTGWVAEHKSVVALAENASSDPRFKRFPSLIEDTYEAFLSVPIVSGGETIGVINVHHRQLHSHSTDEIALLVFVGEQMGGVVSKSLLEEEKAQLVQEKMAIQRQLEERKLVERAKGIIQQKYNTTEEDAYFRL